MSNGDFHGQSVRATSNDSSRSKNPVAQATWSILEERRALQAKAAFEEADRCTRELSAIDAKKYLEARLAQYQDCYEIAIASSHVPTTYHLIIMMDGMSVLKAAIDSINESIGKTISYCKLNIPDVSLAIVMAMFGTRSSKQIVAADAVMVDILKELDLNSLL